MGFLRTRLCYTAHFFCIRNLFDPQNSCTIQHWRKLDIQGLSSPNMRSEHAAVCLGYGGDHSQLLVTGGEGSGINGVLSDVWLLDVQSERWKEVRV